MNTISLRAGKKLSVTIGDVTKQNMKPSSVASFIKEMSPETNSTLDFNVTFVEGAEEVGQSLLDQLIADLNFAASNPIRREDPSFPESQVQDAEEAPARAHRKINLGKGEVFDSSREALAAIASNINANEEANVKLTRNFLRGSLEGRVRSIFQNFQNGGNIAPRLAHLFTGLTADDAEKAAEMANALNAQAVPEDFSPTGYVDHTYFKVWAMIEATKLPVPLVV